MIDKLSQAIKDKDVESIKSLLAESNQNKDVVFENSGLLFSMVVENKDEALLDLLLKHEGVDVNCGFKNPLFFSDYKKAITMFGLRKKLDFMGKTIDDCNVHEQSKGWKVLEDLAERGCVKVKGWDFESGAFIDDLADGAEHYAKLDKEYDEFLAQDGSCLFYAKDSGLTILHLLAYLNNKSLLKKIIEKNVLDINFKDLLGYTPLMMALESGSLGVLNLILEAPGVDLYSANDFVKNSPRMKGRGDHPLVKRLEEKIKSIEENKSMGVVPVGTNEKADGVMSLDDGVNSVSGGSTTEKSAVGGSDASGIISINAVAMSPLQDSGENAISNFLNESNEATGYDEFHEESDSVVLNDGCMKGGPEPQIVGSLDSSAYPGQ